jgi:hypothetical protein
MSVVPPTSPSPRKAGRVTDLDRQMCQVLLELEMVSHGTVQRIGHSTRGEGENPWPAGCKGAEFLWFRGRWNAAFTDEARRKLLAEARDSLERLTGRSRDVKIRQALAVEESKDDRDSRIVELGEGWSTKDAAIHFRVAEADVRRARLGAGREPVLGLLVVVRTAKPDELERVRALKERGMTERQIVSVTRIPKSTVRRLLGRAA